MKAVARAKAVKSLNYHGFEATLQRANLFDIMDGTRTDGDGWALSGRRGGRLYKLYRIPARPLKPFLLSSRAR